MASLWMPSTDVMCIHPGDEPVLGQQAVARSWRSLFRSGDGRFSSSVIKVRSAIEKCACSFPSFRCSATHANAPFHLRVAWPTSEANESE